LLAVGGPSRTAPRSRGGGSFSLVVDRRTSADGRPRARPPSTPIACPPCCRPRPISGPSVAGRPVGGDARRGCVAVTGPRRTCPCPPVAPGSTWASAFGGPLDRPRSVVRARTGRARSTPSCLPTSPGNVVPRSPFSWSAGSALLGGGRPRRAASSWDGGDRQTSPHGGGGPGSGSRVGWAPRRRRPSRPPSPRRGLRSWRRWRPLTCADATPGLPPLVAGPGAVSRCGGSRPSTPTWGRPVSVLVVGSVFPRCRRGSAGMPPRLARGTGALHVTVSAVMCRGMWPPFPPSGAGSR